MKYLMEWYNARKKGIWKTVGIVIFILLLIRILNSVSSQNIKRKQQETATIKDKKITTNSIILEGNESKVSGNKLPTEQLSRIKVLDQFVNYCINGNIDEAYYLLSDECKEEMYPSKEFFKSAYYDQIFDGTKKTVSVENWVNDTYKVRFLNDALSTGIYDGGSAPQDYITIVQDADKNLKLNVNSYIGRKKLNKSGTVGDVSIKVIETNIYMDYQTFTYEFSNKSDKTIMICDPNVNNSMYIMDDKDIEYLPYTHELSLADFKIFAYETRKLTIKYYSRYVSTKEIENIVFRKIIFDYPAYLDVSELYSDYGRIMIEL